MNPAARTPAITSVWIPPSSRSSIRIQRGRDASLRLSPGAIELKSPTIIVRRRAVLVAGHPEDLARARSSRRRSPRRDSPEDRWIANSRISPGSCASMNVRFSPMTCQRTCVWLAASEQRHRVIRPARPERVADLSREPADHLRIRRLLEDRHVGVERGQDLGDGLAATRAALPDVVARDSHGHSVGTNRSTYGWPWTAALRSRNQRAMTWMFTGRPTISWHWRRAGSRAGAAHGS